MKIPVALLHLTVPNLEAHLGFRELITVVQYPHRIQWWALYLGRPILHSINPLSGELRHRLFLPMIADSDLSLNTLRIYRLDSDRPFEPFWSIKDSC